MRVCLVTSSYPRFRGDVAGNFVRDLARHLAALGFDIVVLAPHAPGLPLREEVDGLRVYRFRYFYPVRLERLAYGSGIPTNVRRSWLAGAQLLPFAWAQWRVLRRLVQREGIELVSSQWLVFQGIAGALAHWRLGVPHVCTVHGAGVQALGRLPFGRWVGSFLARHTDCFLAVSSFLEGRLRELVGDGPEVTVLPMGVDLSLFTARPRDMADRERLGLGEGPLLLFIGRLVEVKGLRCLIEAMPEVLRQVPDTRLLVLGEGALYDELQASVRSRGLQEQVRLMGHVTHEEVPGYLAMCDWLVAPSVVDATGRTEGLGLALLEAFASGRPAIASRVGGIPDVLQDGVNGYLARPGDAASLAHQIVRATRESDWESFSTAARRTAERYDQARVARRYAQIFDALAGCKR